MYEGFYVALILLVFVIGYMVRRLAFGFFEGLLFQIARQKRDTRTRADKVEYEEPTERPRMCRSDCSFFDPENGNACFCGRGT